MSTRWAGFRFQNLPDDQLRYYNALKAAHLTCHMIGEMVIAECKYVDEDNGVVGDIVPLTEILARVCDLDRIRALPPEVGRLSGRLLSVRFTDEEIAELEDAIIKSGKHHPDENDSGIRQEEGNLRLLRQGEQEQ